MSENPYSRVYWAVMDDAKFDGIRENVKHFGAWAILLIVADMAHPAPAFLPTTVPKASVRALSDCGLIDLLSGGRYRVHGLASERGVRSDAARNAAAVRWHSAGNAEHMLDETRRDETRRDEQKLRALRREFAPARPRYNTVDNDPHLKAYKAAIIENHGKGMDEVPE